MGRSWGEELISSAWDEKKNTLTETYPSSKCWHLHLNVLFLKDVEGESSSLGMSLHVLSVCACVRVCVCVCVRVRVRVRDGLCSKNRSLWYFQFKEAEISCSFEKLSGIFCGLISSIWECIFIMLMQVAVFSFAPGEWKLWFGGGFPSIYPRPIF